MTKHYDVIVIGAGLGGLSVATMLAKNGLGVLLLERHNVPGGYATSFVRGRAVGEQPYEFEVALHELSGVGPPGRRGAVYRYLEYLGMADKVEFLHVPNLYRSVFLDPSGWSPSGLGLDVTLPTGRGCLCGQTGQNISPRGERHPAVHGPGVQVRTRLCPAHAQRG